MYDEENSLSEALICPNCNSPYDEPKILPCGKIVCNECIAIIICRNNKACKKFKCLCDQSHQLPPKGEFPTCGPLLKLIQKRMDSNSRLNLSQCLKENIGKLKAKMNEYTKDIYSGTDLIKKHCENERNAISLECDILCKELEKSRDAFIEKVNEYEAKRLEKLSECIDKQKCKFSIDMDSIDETETERNLFNSSKYNEKFLEEANDVVKDRIEELENEHKCFLESPLFGDGKPLFKPQVGFRIVRKQVSRFLIVFIFYSKKSTNLLGSLDISFQENKIKDMNNLDLTSVLCNYKTVEFIDFIGGVNLFVSCRSKTSEYLLIDLETSSILYKFAEKDEHVKAINALFLQIKTDDWKIMVNVIDKNGCNFLKMFDLKMELLHQVKVFEYSLIGLDHGKLSSCPQEKLEQTRNVYCISRNSSSLHIKIYNWKLEYVNAIGQSENPDKKCKQ
jgi:hypothetical protein